ncbi:MAG: CAP domain-containing protein [Candidatus Saccharimonadales bacterium]
MTEKKQTALHHRVKHHIHMAVMPHKKNNYQPHLVRLPGLMFVLVVAFTLNIFYFGFHQGAVLGEFKDTTMDQLLAATNAERQKKGSEPLVLNTELSKAAALKAKDMFATQYWAHTSPTGTTPWVWFQEVGYDYSHAGENLARGFNSANGVVTAWMASTEHRDNLLDVNYKDVGFAVVSGELEGEKTNVIVALYGAPSVIGASLSPTSVFASTTTAPLSPIARLGVAVQSLTPAALGSIILLMFTAGVALLAHAYRKKLPKSFQRSWRVHHGLYKAVGMTSLAVVILTLFSGGQI